MKRSLFAAAAAVATMLALPAAAATFETAARTTTFANGTDFTQASGSKTATVSAKVVQTSTANGCGASSAGSLAGAAALTARGTCTFDTKVSNAAAAGASATLIYQTGSGAFGAATTVPNPALLVSQAVGSDLLALLPYTTPTANISTVAGDGSAATFSVSQDAVHYAEDQDFATFNPPRTFDITAELGLSDPSDALGCSAYASGAFAGEVALIGRGTCSFATKLENAMAAGALGAIVYDTDDDIAGGVTSGLNTFPAIFVTHALGEALMSEAAVGALDVHIAASAGVPEPATWAFMIGGFGLAGAAVRRRRASARLV